MKYLFFATSAALSLMACNGTPAESENTATNDNTQTAARDETASESPTSDEQYVAKAGAGDLWEIDSSQAVLAKTKNPEVKTFAQMMVTHHKQSTEKIKAAAKSANVDVPVPQIDASQQQMLTEIKNADPATVDQIYIGHQKTAHDQALALHKTHANTGASADLKTAASEIAGVVQEHIEQLKKLKSTNQ